MYPLPPGLVTECVKKHASLLEGQRSWRNSWLGHWGELSQNFQPRRYKWFVSPNDNSRGTAMNAHIIDETGLLAARYLSAGMLSGLTSPTKPWFRLSLEGQSDDNYGPVRLWLAEVERRMFRVLAHSNYYQSMAVFYMDEVIFGSASKIIYEDAKDVIRCYNPCLGEFFFGLDKRMSVGQHSREFTYSIDQMVEEFGIDACSQNVQNLHRNGGSSRTNEVVVCHIIERNTPTMYEGVPVYLAPPMFPWREVYWEKANPHHYLRRQGFFEQPFSAGRWSVSSNDPYGSCPGMEALPAIKQLRQEQLRKAEAIDKLVRPPMVAHVSLKNEAKSLLPGGTTYVVDTQNASYKPAYQIELRLTEMMEDIKEVQGRIDEVFYKDLFMMISQLDTVRTATEIDARREEKLLMIGPVVERNENEVLDVDLARLYGIMNRRGLFPKPPKEMHGKPLQIQYISWLAEMQRASDTAAVDRIWQLAGGIAAAVPEVLDKLDADKTIDIYMDRLNGDPRIIRGPQAVKKIRDARAQQQQAMQQAAMAQAAAASGKVLSDTTVGQGNTALDAILGQGAQQ